MNETQAKPRRRRRWLIAGLLVAVVSLATWCSWPRGDQRFVGRWNYFTEMRLLTNCFGLQKGLPKAQGSWAMTRIFRWRVDGAEFVEEPVIGNLAISNCLNFLLGHAGLRLTTTPSRSYFRFPEDGSGNVLVMSFADSTISTALTRIPE